MSMSGFRVRKWRRLSPSKMLESHRPRPSHVSMPRPCQEFCEGFLPLYDSMSSPPLWTSSPLLLGLTRSNILPRFFRTFFSRISGRMFCVPSPNPGMQSYARVCVRQGREGKQSLLLLPRQRPRPGSVALAYKRRGGCNLSTLLSPWPQSLDFN